MIFVNRMTMSFESFYRPNPNFPNRYISPETVEKFLQENLSDYISTVGYSHEGRSIYKVSIGTGRTRVLAWSQMHGNESNSTHALFDMLFTLQELPHLQQDLFSRIKLDFIVMLNPDGSALWTRRNAIDIDLNRDYVYGSSKEFPILRGLAENGSYDYGLNLHEQRTLFSTDGQHPATLSFLAPAENKEREVTPTRKKAMAVIAELRKLMEGLVPNQVARYNDEFYPSSTGDNFTKMGLATILFEGGHFQGDYLRKETRKYYTIALYYALQLIAELKGSTEGYEAYFEIPENKESHFDLIYRNVRLETSYECILDIAVQYKEEKRKENPDISFVPMVVEVGDCSSKKGWVEIDCTGKKFKCDRKYPKLDAPMDFEIL